MVICKLQMIMKMKNEHARSSVYRNLLLILMILMPELQNVGNDRYIRVNLLASWDKSLGEHTILQKPLLEEICTTYAKLV